MIPRIYPGLNRGSPKALSFQPYIRSTMFDASNSPVGTWKSAYRRWFHDHSVSTQRFTQLLSIYPQIITLCQRRSNGWTARRKRNDSSAIVFHLIAFVFTFRCCVYILVLVRRVLLKRRSLLIRLLWTHGDESNRNDCLKLLKSM